MKKEKLIKIGAVVVLICILIGMVTYVVADYARPEYTWGDDYYSVNFYKEYTVFSVPSTLEDGEQYEFIMVDKFLPISERGHGSYGFLRVNETTGLIEFIKWRTSNESYIVWTNKSVWTNESTNSLDSFTWFHFGINEKDYIPPTR